jgi:hypothetical protein
MGSKAHEVRAGALATHPTVGLQATPAITTR